MPEELTLLLAHLRDAAPLWGGAALLLYLYFSTALMVIARKTGVPNAGLAFVPLINTFYLCRVARRSMGWVLVMAFPLTTLIGVLVIFGALARVCGRSGWLAWLMLVPVVNLLLPGYLAWSTQGGRSGTPGRGPAQTGPTPAEALTLTIGGRTASLSPATGLAADKISGAREAGLVGRFGVVVAKPGDPHTLGLKNLSLLDWEVAMPGRDTLTVRPGQAFRLQPGTTVHFGALRGTVGGRSASPPPPQPVPGGAAWGSAWRLAIAVTLVLLAIGAALHRKGIRKPTATLISQLAATDGAARLTAVSALGERQAKDAVASLLDRATDDEKELRDAAIHALAQIGTPAVPALIDAFASPATAFDQAAAADAALTAMGAASVPELEKLLGDADADRRRAAVIALGRQKAAAYPAVLRALQRGESRVCLAALETLPRLGPVAADATDTVVGLLRHEDPMVRANAAYALARFGLDGAEAVPALVAALDDPAPPVRASAALALGEMAPAAQAAVEPLRRLESDPEAYVAEQAGLSLRLVLRSRGLPAQRPPREDPS